MAAAEFTGKTDDEQQGDGERHSDDDEAALKWFTGQTDRAPLSPTHGGQRILERIKTEFENRPDQKGSRD